MAGAYSKQDNPTEYPINGGFVFDGKDYISVYIKDSEKGPFGSQANGINYRQEVAGVFIGAAGTFHGLNWGSPQSNVPYSECHST